MRLLAISDLHLAAGGNRAALDALAPQQEDWLIVAGDVAESLALFADAMRALRDRFARVIWVPGNHDLWTEVARAGAPRGEAKYRALVEAARAAGVTTPEDEYPLWPGAEGPVAIVPMFLLYDYSFRPDDVAREDVVQWSSEAGIGCVDELVLHSDPHPSRDAWCAARCALTETRLAALPPDMPKVLVNHYPLRQDLVRLRRIPRFSPWCGTRRTEDWHLRFGARVVVSGHLHIRSTAWRDGVRFEEVSLGYPRDWDAARGIAGYFRTILPTAEASSAGVMIL
jgi:predicted phosphodiesterase